VVCNIPQNLNTTSITENTAILNWDAVPFATGYNVQYRIVGSTLTTTLSTLTNNLLIGGLTQGTGYEWQVQSDCGNGNKSSYSAVVTFTTLGTCAFINAFEPNETLAAAASIPTGVENLAGIVSATDLDWFKFSNAGSRKNIMVELYNLPADYDLKLFSSNGSQLGVSQNSGSIPEKIIYNNGKVGTYYIEVYGHDGAFNGSECYTFKASLSSSSYQVTTQGIPSDNYGTPLLYSVYPNPANGSVNVDYNSTGEGVLNISIYNVLGSKLADSKNIAHQGLNNYKIDLSAFQKGIYMLDINNGQDRSFVKLLILE